MSGRRRAYRIGAAIAAGMAAVVTSIVWSRVAAARSHRRRLVDGEIRELRSLWAWVGECRIHARASTGSAMPGSLPVVLVHGFGVSSSYFVPTAERLAPEFSVYAPDLPGHGRSDTPREPLDIPQLADSLIAWMDAIGLPRASLVGNSMGCQIAVDAAVRYPDRVDRLVLVGPAGDPAGRSVGEQFRRLLVGGLYERVSLNRLLVKDYCRMGWRLRPEFCFMLGNRIETKLPLVTVPVMFVRGEKDTIAPQRWIDQAARLAGAERCAVIAGWGHAVNYSAAPQLVDAVAPFLRE